MKLDKKKPKTIQEGLCIKTGKRRLRIKTDDFDWKKLLIVSGTIEKNTEKIT